MELYYVWSPIDPDLLTAESGIKLVIMRAEPVISIVVSVEDDTDTTKLDLAMASQGWIQDTRVIDKKE